MVEDALTAILPIIQEDMISTIVRGVEDAILNGDTAGTHQDTDTTAATDRRKAWDGLRKAGLANTPDDASDAILTAVMLRATRKLVTLRGVNPADLVYIVGVKAYVDLLSDTNIQTVDKFGTAATWLTGFISAVDGIPVVVSEFQREDLNAAGVDDGVTATRGVAMCVHRPTWKMGDRRMVTLKTDEIISTDQVDVVATVRKDFAEVLGSPSVGQVDNTKTP